MSFDVKVRHTADSGGGISVEAKVNGEPVAHTFPKDMGFFEEPDEGKPPFVEKLIEKYKEKQRREQRISVQETSTEEAKIHSGHFENKNYGDSENFKEEDNVNDSMTNVDTSDPEQIRAYLKENMAEGYLSKEEGMNIDQFVDEYTELLQTKDNIEKIVRKAYEGKVQ